MRTFYLAYLWYVIRHKWFVYRAGRSLRLVTADGVTRVPVPVWQLLVHDWSKFLPCEFGPYARYFYGPKTDDRDKALLAFNAAWLHHQHCAPHHWQHWVLRKDDGGTLALNMPYRYVLEMVADWMGAGRALSKPDTVAWYRANKHKMVLHPATERMVEWLLGLREGVMEWQASEHG